MWLRRFKKLGAVVLLSILAGFGACSVENSPVYLYAGPGYDWRFMVNHTGIISAASMQQPITLGGSFDYTPTGLLRWTLEFSSGPRVPAAGPRFAALDIPGTVLFSASPMADDKTGVDTMVATGPDSCPSADFTTNWIFTRWNLANDLLTGGGREVGGTMSFSALGRTATFTPQFTATGAAIAKPSQTITVACDQGISPVTYDGTGGSIYLTQGAFALSLVNQYTMFGIASAQIGAVSSLAGNYSGLVFDSAASVMRGVSATVLAGAGNSGSISFQGLADDLIGPDNAFAGSATFNIDAPAAGFVTAQITSGGKPAVPSLCLASSPLPFSKKKILACAGVAPGTHAGSTPEGKPYNLLLVSSP